MHERHIIRTAEAMCDDLDARLARMTPRQITRREYWDGARDALIFCAIAGAVVFVCLLQGGM
jgi:hypothetical protein